MALCLRTMIYVPGYQKKFLDKAAEFEADALILDIEDSVPYGFKADARKNISEYLDKEIYKQKVFIRLNCFESGLLLQDLEAVVKPSVYGFMPSMVKDENDIVFLDKQLTQYEADMDLEQGKFKLCPLIETGSGVLKVLDIAKASSRVIGVAFGSEDYLTDLDGLHKEHGTSILVARSMIVMAARSLGLEAIDTPYLDVHNIVGYKKALVLARELGFSGNLILHPTQLEVTNSIFTPSDEEVAEAERIIEAIEESKKEGKGVTLLDGKLIGPPMEKRAKNVLKKVRLIKES